jgi:hypothetical protein
VQFSDNVVGIIMFKSMLKTYGSCSFGLLVTVANTTDAIKITPTSMLKFAVPPFVSTFATVTKSPPLTTSMLKFAVLPFVSTFHYLQCKSNIF